LKDEDDEFLFPGPHRPRNSTQQPSYTLTVVHLVTSLSL